MKKNTLSTIALFLGTVCILLAVMMFAFLDGLERWYSWVFFAIIGAVMLVNGLRWRSDTSE